MELNIQNLSFRYGRGREIFRDISLTLQSGEVLSLLGANGAGKSTLLNCIAGLYHPASGTILLDGQPLPQLSRTEIARHIGYVPQIHDTVFSYSVEAYTVMGRTPYIRPYSQPSPQDYEIVRASLRRVGMDGMEHRIFCELSGGEQQLVSVARVLTQQPDIILLDEPTNHLDYGNQHRLLGVLRSLAADGYTVIMTTHNPDHALMLGGRAAILTPGAGITTGPAEDILTPERLSALYGMEIGVSYLADAGRKLCYIRTGGAGQG